MFNTTEGSLAILYIISYKRNSSNSFIGNLQLINLKYDHVILPNV